MTRLNKVLFVSQDPAKEQALFDWTLSLAKRHQASLICLRVFPAVSVGLTSWINNVSPSDVMTKQTQFGLESMHVWYQQARQQGIELKTNVAFGKLFYKAIQMALVEQVDWVVKQTDEEAQDIPSRIFGSQDMHLLRKCPCPILLHKRGANLELTNVMASIDVDLESESVTMNPLNETILGLAQDLAQAEKAQLHVAHAWQAEAENLVRYWNSDMSDEDMINFNESIRNQHLSALEYEIRALRETQPDLKVHAAKGQASEVIPRLVLSHNVDLLVMGTLGRAGLPGLVIGNTAESILERVQCSVLAIKPDGFVSPVTL